MSEPPPHTPIGQVGRIVASRDPREVGWFLEVQDDRDGSTGGLYIVTWRAAEGYDGWIESADHLDAYVAEAGYVIEWLTDPEAAAARKRSQP